MRRFFEVREDKASRRTGFVDGTHVWSLPGVQCSLCKAGWSTLGEHYPSVDLSQHPERAAFENLESDSLAEFKRLRELVRSLAPRDAPLEPGAGFGPVRGTVSGSFGDFHLPMPWMLMAKPETLEKLRAEGVRGLSGFPMELSHQGKKPPALLDVELQTRGQLHPVCFPETWKASCPRCGRNGNTLPDAIVLDGATLPADMDVFRLRDYPTVIIASERFVRAVERLGLDEIVFTELPVR